MSERESSHEQQNNRLLDIFKPISQAFLGLLKMLGFKRSS